MHRILPSTTSHKREPLVMALEIFAKLGFRDLDLNLHHFIEEGLPVRSVAEALRREDQRVWIVSGGWCDFFHTEPRVDETFASVARQIAMAQELGAGRLRLFFGRLARVAYSPTALETIAGNLRRLSDRHPGIDFVFENHDGASLDPAICREVLDRVDRPNIRMNFDPINFEHVGVDSLEALRTVLPHVAHVHLKGYDGLEFCEFGAGTLDLTPVLRTLLESGYEWDFTVEYEGPLDKTLRLYRGVLRARAVLQDLTAPARNR